MHHLPWKDLLQYQLLMVRWKLSRVETEIDSSEPSRAQTPVNAAVIKGEGLQYSRGLK
jgi:hypothetical protein